MNAAQIYFSRNQGEWDWVVRFSLTSWSQFVTSPLSLINKLRFFTMIIAQAILGPFKMHTRVQLIDAHTIGHITEISKLGVIAAKSIKTFTIAKDGHGLALRGEESFWPMAHVKTPFRPMYGKVLESTSSAEYEMPFLGSHCDCRTNLVANVGEIEVETPWMNGKFVLTEKSQGVLAQRFKS